MPNLTAFGATEYMDGALTLPVLMELFLRGFASRGSGRPSRGRGLITNDSDAEEDDRERRRDCKDLLAHGDDSSGSEDEERMDMRRSRKVRIAREDPSTFPGLQRLCLRGVKSVQPHILTPFVLAFPSLTHLDLSATRVTPELLAALGESSAKLRSLALARCIRLTGEAIKNFLVRAPAAARIQELTLYGDQTFPSPLSAGDLNEIFTLAPCFISGELTYLDLSSSPITRELLCDVCKPQPQLRSLGLSYIPDLELEAIATFIKNKAVNVEVLTLASTSPELDWSRAGPGGGRGYARQASIALHTKIIGPLCTPPYVSVFSTQLIVPRAPTRLRVIELSMPTLVGLGMGAGTWRTIRSKGGRGWYVDSASGWVSGELHRQLPADHPLRAEIDRLANANGNISSGVGWHARKMEVLHGHGMLGREDGLYGAVSFAYQG